MKVYRVMSLTDLSDDSWELLRTTDKQEAVNFAKNRKKANNDNHRRIELWVNEIPDSLNFKTFDDSSSDDYDKDAAELFWFENDFVYFDFADKLNEFRKEKHLTVPAFAKFLGVPQRTLENWLAEKNAPSDITQNAVIEKISK